MSRLKKVVLSEEMQRWKYENDEVMLEHIRFWILKVTQLGLTEMSITFNPKKGTYFCKAIK